MEQDSYLLAMVSQPIAREIVRALADGEADVTTLAKRLELDDSAVSKYLSRLREGNIVTYRRKWRHHIYRLTDNVCIETSETSDSVEITTLEGQRLTVTYSIPGSATRKDHLSSASDDK